MKVEQLVTMLEALASDLEGQDNTCGAFLCTIAAQRITTLKRNVEYYEQALADCEKARKADPQ